MLYLLSLKVVVCCTKKLLILPIQLLVVPHTRKVPAVEMLVVLMRLEQPLTLVAILPIHVFVRNIERRFVPGRRRMGRIPTATRTTVAGRRRLWRRLGRYLTGAGTGTGRGCGRVGRRYLLGRVVAVVVELFVLMGVRARLLAVFVIAVQHLGVEQFAFRRPLGYVLKVAVFL